MAGRAATAVKSRAKAKSTSKVSARTKSSKTASSAKTTSPSAETAKEAPKPKTRRRTKTETRTRIYWAVFNQSLKRVAVFEFDQKGEAEKRAAKLTSSSGDQHFIQKIKATVQV